MMTAMMLPSASPLVLLYAGALHASAATVVMRRQMYALAAGYVLVWALFSVGRDGACSGCCRRRCC